MICDQELKKRDISRVSQCTVIDYSRDTEDLLGKDGCETILEVSVTVEGERIT